MSVKVIIVDDHHFIRRSLAVFLTIDSEIEVVATAADGLEAINKTRELSPDVVIMDIELPVLNGFEATVRIKKEQPATRVIAWSANYNEYMATKALAAGAEVCLAKGTDNNKLIAAIKDAIKISPI